MLANNCPCGKIVCDDCFFLKNGDCTYERNVQFAITSEEINEIHRKERERLLNLPKETLVEMIIGKNAYNVF